MAATLKLLGMASSNEEVMAAALKVLLEGWDTIWEKIFDNLIHTID
jgi:hypothetical protein